LGGTSILTLISDVIIFMLPKWNELLKKLLLFNLKKIHTKQESVRNEIICAMEKKSSSLKIRHFGVMISN
jgi:hypothetical protein